MDYLRWPSSQLDTLPMITLANAFSPANANASLYNQLTAALPARAASHLCDGPRDGRRGVL